MIFSVLSFIVISMTVCHAIDRWERSDNEVLYKNMLSYVRSIQTASTADPAHFMFQDFLIEVQAAHLRDPYAWIGQTHRLCDRLEKIYPPVLEHTKVQAEDSYAKIRKCILSLRDYPMHVQTLKEDGITPPDAQVQAFNKYNKSFVQLKRDELFQFLASPRPQDGSIQVVKLYSSGFILRTREHCIGLDICYDEGLYSPDRKDELVSQMDALFNTHGHGDHFDRDLMRKMVKAGKPVVMPTDVIPDTPGSSKVIWADSQEVLTDICPGVKAHARMGAQTPEPCLIFIIQIDGWRLAAHGDNNMYANQVFYEDKEMVDLMIAPTFTAMETFFGNVNKMPNPNNVAHVYISAHENEFHHETHGRISYTAFSASVLNSLYNRYPGHYVMIDCGEAITLSK